ncbi:MAG: DUF3536 domain-containing protein [Chitinivibrionales bacterium]|nr:DUF3536 domain-containing protein [Chitinivibrionales bacterium]MBD3395170.1 DUF3536 domain-containing protein [Chitinivibrionales bacterium]
MTGSSGDTSRYCIIHGHFYQPPRENPWIDTIEAQPSAAPAHDWNERVYDECYRPNARSRVLDPGEMIEEIHNNYRFLSFNFGPTLFRWLEKKHPRAAASIIEADRESCDRLDGHGNALAQVYNHIILPLASRRDKLTQIRWGKAFFRSQFGREPEGMWLSETAIDMETVVCLIEEGIRFVVLSPGQIEASRPLDAEREWVPADKTPVDTRNPCRIFPYDAAGKRGEGHLDVFLFDEGLSRETSFGGLLESAHGFGERLSAALDPRRAHPQAAIIATDGETFGHHKPYGDMCLAYFFMHAAGAVDLTPVSFGYFLAQSPPSVEVKLRGAFDGGSSWSCAHGTGRWCRDCGCATGGRAGWNQAWRDPLRSALDALQERIDRAFEDMVSRLGADPWALRDRYAEIMDSNDIASLVPGITGEQSREALRLLEAQKYMLFAFTSCGWFFADIGGLEAVQNLRYACRALQLGLRGDAFEDALAGFSRALEAARGNVGTATGRSILTAEVLPQMRHREILSFAAAVRRVVSESRERTSCRFGYTIDVRPVDRMRKRQTDAFVISVTDSGIGETSVHSVCLRHGYSARTAGYVLPFDVERTEGFDARDLKKWTGHGECVRLVLKDIYIEERAGITRLLRDSVAASTRAKYLSWMRANEKVLGALAGLNGQLPHFLQGPVAYLLTAEWDDAIVMLRERGGEDEVFARLLEISRRAGTYGVVPDYTLSIALLERLLLEQIHRLARDLSPDACDSIRFLMNVTDRFAIPVAKHRLEDAFYPVVRERIGPMYETHGGRAAGERADKASMAGLLGLVRRMNFSTRRFPLD